MVPEIDTFMTTEETAKLLHCSTHYVTHLRQAGLLTGTRYGKRWLYTSEDIQNFLDITHGKDLSNFREMLPDVIQKEYGVHRT